MQRKKIIVIFHGTKELDGNTKRGATECYRGILIGLYQIKQTLANITIRKSQVNVSLDRTKLEFECITT